MTMQSGAVVWGAVLTACLLWSAVPAEAKTRKECNAEWTANKATAEAAGKTRRGYIDECLGLPPKAPAALEKGQFKTEAEAKTSCPTDNVVWVNLKSKIYHASTSKVYGKTKNGAYMCEKESTAAGFRAPKGAKSAKRAT
jgi:hypothetical protein